MPQIIKTTVFTFDELNDAAKEKAREWYRERIETYEWSDHVIEQWENETLPAMGFPNAKISFSGFWSQGDGASFTSGFDVLAYLKHSGTKCRPLVLKLLESGKLCVSGGFYRKTHHYSHENTVSFEFEHDGHGGLKWIDTYLGDLLKDVQSEGKAIMRKIYRELEAAYDFEHSDEYVDECILSNEYTFTETGERFG